MTLDLLLLGIVLTLLQIVAALPWMAALTWDWLWPQLQQLSRRKLAGRVLRVLIVIFGPGLAYGLSLAFQRDPIALEWWGRVYAFILQGQLIADFFVLGFAAWLRIWPKGTAVAMAAFREGVRQPTFWLILCIALVLMFFFVLTPFFTITDDTIMMKELDYNLIMVSAVLFGVMAASMSISEEIEGRTAVTLMSKPVSRRQFLLGKFAGNLLAALLMTMIFGWLFNWFILLKVKVVDPPFVQDPNAPPPIPSELAWMLHRWVPPGEMTHFFRGVGLWVFDLGDIWPGLGLGFCQVTVLLAVAVTLATRLPLIVNIVSCAFIYVVGHLAPVLVQNTEYSLSKQPDRQDVVLQMVHFIAKMLYTILPGMDFFSVGPALVNDPPLPVWGFSLYVGSAALYASFYTAIILIVGLILFEDRDLA